jgi:hypothetical protein
MRNQIYVTGQDQIFFPFLPLFAYVWKRNFHCLSFMLYLVITVLDLLMSRINI